MNENLRTTAANTLNVVGGVVSGTAHGVSRLVNWTERLLHNWVTWLVIPFMLVLFLYNVWGFSLMHWMRNLAERMFSLQTIPVQGADAATVHYLIAALFAAVVVVVVFQLLVLTLRSIWKRSGRTFLWSTGMFLLEAAAIGWFAYQVGIDKDPAVLTSTQVIGVASVLLALLMLGGGTILFSWASVKKNQLADLQWSVVMLLGGLVAISLTAWHFGVIELTALLGLEMLALLVIFSFMTGFFVFMVGEAYNNLDKRGSRFWLTVLTAFGGLLFYSGYHWVGPDLTPRGLFVYAQFMLSFYIAIGYLVPRWRFWTSRGRSVTQGADHEVHVSGIDEMAMDDLADVVDAEACDDDIDH